MNKIIELLNKYFELSKVTNGDLVLIITGFIILLYTYFTYRLWKESVLQTFLQNIPIPALYLRSREEKDHLRIRNIGSKPMMNIEIEDWNIHFFSKKLTYRDKYKFIVPSPNIIIPGEEIDINIEQFIDDNKQSSSSILPLFINPKFSPFSSPIHIFFYDISGKKYFTKFLFGKGQFKMIGAVKRSSIIKIFSIKLSDLVYKLKEPFLKYILLKKEKSSQK